MPTPATEDVPMSCQLLASLLALVFTADVSSAFGQKIKGQRKEAGGKRLFATPPKEGIPGEDPNEESLIEILAEIYGLVSGPPGWRQTLLTQFKSLNFKRHPLAPCVVLMYETINGVKDALSGMIVIETDDLLGGGIGPLFQDAMDKLRKKFNFGSWHYIKDASKQYGGRTVRQLEDYSITIDMNRYLRERAHEIKIEKGRKPDAKCTPCEITAGRGLMGSLNWATREGMPQGAGDCSMLASCFGGDGPVVSDLLEMNALFRRLKKDAVVITIHSIPLNRLKGLVFTDASLANNKDQRTQVCYLACMADQSILDGKEAKVSVLAYKSHKMTRSASNVLYTESFGMSDGLAFMEWMSTWFGLAKDLHYRIQERDILNRDIQLTSIMSSAQSKLPEFLAVSDSKSLYDNMIREQFTATEKRSALEIAVIRDSMRSMQAQARWVPHELNCSDCLTKKKGNAQALLKLLHTGTYQLVVTEDELKRRKEEREATGKRNARPKRLNINSEVDGSKRHSRYSHAQDGEQTEREFRAESPVPGPSKEVLRGLSPSWRKFYSSQYSSPKNSLRSGKQSAEKPVKVLYQCCSSESEEEAAAEESVADLSVQVADPVSPQEPVSHSFVQVSTSIANCVVATPSPQQFSDRAVLEQRLEDSSSVLQFTGARETESDSDISDVDEWLLLEQPPEEVKEVGTFFNFDVMVAERSWRVVNPTSAECPSRFIPNLISKCARCHIEFRAGFQVINCDWCGVPHCSMCGDCRTPDEWEKIWRILAREITNVRPKNSMWSLPSQAEKGWSRQSWARHSNAPQDG